jgi:peptidoglycan/LPS O-acetylase OafA/YrhL
VALPHHRGLDGLRGIAVAAVLLYHGGVPLAQGGFLGVEIFFVLSGFLITSLLVAEWRRSSTIALLAFWGRRARRLLPALFCVVCAVGVYYTLAGPTHAVPGLEGDGIATVFYYSNWHQIAIGTTYFAASGPVSPLQHTWSLAIEEQFYLLWPLVMLAALWLARRRRCSTERSLQALLVVSLAGVVVSAAETAILFNGGTGLDRVYYGADTRAGSLLVGASAAIVLSLAGPRAWRPKGWLIRPRITRPLGWAGLLVLGGVAAAVALVGGTMSWLYPFGLLALDAVVVALIVIVVRAPRTPVARVLALAPLRALGTISYGVYLWHFPLFQWLDTADTHVIGVALLGVRLGATLAASLLSYVLIEQPIRQRRPAWLIRGLAPVAAGGAVASLMMASTAASLPVGVPAAARVPRAPSALRGTDAPCSVSLADTSGYGLSPVAAGQEAKFEYGALGVSQLTWNGSSRKTFQTCPPKKVMMIGDSLAFTLGLPMMSNEQNYGLELANAARLGCSFTATGQLNVNGTWEAQPAGCPGALSEWAHEERTLKPQEVVVELGYRDEFDWRIGGRVEHLGQASFDTYLQSRIDRYVKVLGRNGTKILFLSVPYTHPPDLPDGSPAPAASRSRHTLINAMLRTAARRDPGQVQVLDIDRTISPHDSYTAKVKGQLCRFDGIHFSVYCSELLEPQVLGEVRKTTG